MDNDTIHKMGSLSAKVAKAVMESGLTWDEGIAALGVATKAIALQASREGAGLSSDCVARAHTSFQQGMDKAPDEIKRWLKN